MLDALPPKQPTISKPSDVVYSEEELESTISISDSASYFEKAQDFKHIVKTLRIQYLGLKPRTKTDDKGNVFVEYVKDTNKITGINQEGVEANIRFLETRMGKHSVLTSWTEKRMMEVLLFDMFSWLDMMIINYERFALSDAALIELCALINDELEFIYRRGIDNKEREDMRPATKELRHIAERMLGIGDEDRRNAYPPEFQQNSKDALQKPGY
jgi:hypothetical protein